MNVDDCNGKKLNGIVIDRFSFGCMNAWEKEKRKQQTLDLPSKSLLLGPSELKILAS